MDLPFDACGLFYQPVCPFQIVINPPFWGTLYIAHIYIETAAEALVNGRVVLLHFLHEQLLFGRAHGHKYYIGLFIGYVFY